MENEPKKSNILIIGTALFFDFALALIWLVPFIGPAGAWAFSIFPLMTFLLWFKMRGMNFMTPKRVFTLPGAYIIEAILSILPAWTMSVLILLGTEKIKQVTGAQKKETPVTDINDYRRIQADRKTSARRAA